MHLKGADYITFKNLGFEATDQYDGRVLYISEGAENIIFENNYFLGVSTSSSYTSRAVIFGEDSDKNEDSLTFLNNRIENGSYGMYLDGNYYDHEKGFVIKHNQFIHQGYTGLRMNNNTAPEVSHNTIRTDITNGFFFFF